MKVIVADKISDRGVQLLKEQPGWNIVLTTKDTIDSEIADAEALIVRSATKVTAELLDQAWRPGHEHARWQRRQRRRTHFRADAGPRPASSASRQSHSRRPLGKI